MIKNSQNGNFILFFEKCFPLILLYFFRMTDALGTAAHDDSLPHDYGASKAVQLIAKTMRWTMEKCLCETTSKTSEGTNTLI